MDERPRDLARVARVLVSIALRLTEQEEQEHADGGLLPSLDRGASRGGFSIDGQAEKLRTYAELHDLGEVTVVVDPGRSGKDLERPGLQQLLLMVESGHVANVLTWRLDRLSRNLGDLILLADKFGQAGVALHSFTERLDLSSATGRMFYNILGSFAQFYREQLAENVRMGMAQAARQGKWVNRPKTGYDLVDGELVPNEMAPIVRQIFRLRAQGLSQRDIEQATGVNYSTILTILRSRIYLGEVVLNGEWFPGRHTPLVTAEEFDAAHRGRIKGRRRGKDLLSGKVRCGLCDRLMPIETNGDGRSMYRCRHRGQGCAQPRRSNKGLLRAALLGIRLIADDEDLQAAIRNELARAGRPKRSDGGRPAARDSDVHALLEQRRKLLRLHSDGNISAELFAEEEDRLTHQLAAVRADLEVDQRVEEQLDDVAQRFEQVAQVLKELDLDQLWEAATDQERRVLLEELLDGVTVHPDHLEVTVHGAPRLNVLLSEVGLGESQISGVGGGT